MQNRNFRIGLVLFLFLTAIAVAVVLVLYGAQLLSSKNRHFLLRDVKVESSGWWNKKNRKVMNDLNLEIGKTNLFDLDLKKLRQTLLNMEPSIAKVSLKKVLPDTLVRCMPHGHVSAIVQPVLILPVLGFVSRLLSPQGRGWERGRAFE